MHIIWTFCAYILRYMISSHFLIILLWGMISSGRYDFANFLVTSAELQVPAMVHFTELLLNL